MDEAPVLDKKKFEKLSYYCVIMPHGHVNPRYAAVLYEKRWKEAKVELRFTSKLLADVLYINRYIWRIKLFYNLYRLLLRYFLYIFIPDHFGTTRIDNRRI